MSFTLLGFLLQIYCKCFQWYRVSYFGVACNPQVDYVFVFPVVGSAICVCGANCQFQPVTSGALGFFSCRFWWDVPFSVENADTRSLRERKTNVSYQIETFNILMYWLTEISQSIWFQNELGIRFVKNGRGKLKVLGLEGTDVVNLASRFGKSIAFTLGE